MVFLCWIWLEQRYRIRNCVLPQSNPQALKSSQSDSPFCFHLLLGHIRTSWLLQKGIAKPLQLFVQNIYMRYMYRDFRILNFMGSHKSSKYHEYQMCVLFRLTRWGQQKLFSNFFPQAELHCSKRSLTQWRICRSRSVSTGIPCWHNWNSAFRIQGLINYWVSINLERRYPNLVKFGVIYLVVKAGQLVAFCTFVPLSMLHQKYPCSNARREEKTACSAVCSTLLWVQPYSIVLSFCSPWEMAPSRRNIYLWRVCFCWN